MLEKRYRVDADAAEDDAPPHEVAPGRVPRTIGLLPAILFRKPAHAGGIDEGAEAAVARAADSSGAPLDPFGLHLLAH